MTEFDRGASDGEARGGPTARTQRSGAVKCGRARPNVVKRGQTWSNACLEGLVHVEGVVPAALAKLLRRR